MLTININEARSRLSRLVDEAAKGKPFLIAKRGKPLVKVTPLDTPAGKRKRRLGFLRGQFKVPDDFNRMGGAEIGGMFGRGKAKARVCPVGTEPQNPRKTRQYK